MKLYFEGRIKATNSRDFKSDDGVSSRRYTYYVQAEGQDQPEVVQLNSKLDLYKLTDKRALFAVELYRQRDGKGFWRTITGAREMGEEDESHVPVMR